MKKETEYLTLLQLKGRAVLKHAHDEELENLEERRALILQSGIQDLPLKRRISAREHQEIFEAKVVKAYKLIKSTQRIATDLDVPIQEVRMVLHKKSIKKFRFNVAQRFSLDYDLRTDFKSMWNSGKFTKPDMASFLGISTSSITHISKELGLPSLHNLEVTQKKDRKIKRMYEKGMSLEYIADQIGLCDETIRQRLQKQGIARRPNKIVSLRYAYNNKHKIKLQCNKCGCYSNTEKAWHDHTCTDKTKKETHTKEAFMEAGYTKTTLTPTKLHNHIKQHYVEELWSIKDLAKYLAIDRTTIKKRLDEQGIPVKKRKTPKLNPKPCEWCTTIIPQPYNQGQEDREQKYCSGSCKTLASDFKRRRPHASKRWIEMHKQELNQLEVLQ